MVFLCDIKLTMLTPMFTFFLKTFTGKPLNNDDLSHKKNKFSIVSTDVYNTVHVGNKPKGQLSGEIIKINPLNRLDEEDAPLSFAP